MHPNIAPRQSLSRHCLGAPPDSKTTAADLPVIAAAVADPSRPVADTVRDINRKPILELAGGVKDLSPIGGAPRIYNRR